MLVFGHAGLTLGAAVVLDGVVSRVRAAPTAASEQPQRSLLRRVDLRVLLVGSLLPDLVDKPVGWLFFDCGRVFCHTLLFCLLISLGAFWVWRHSHGTWGFALAFGSFLHLILDSMWDYPSTLLWPLYGLEFKRPEDGDWVDAALQGLCTNPAVYVPEAVGLAILVGFLLVLVRRRKLQAFAGSGRFE
ncbi:MAG: metal-dependent hydrolase [Chloroflexi bacterium]|nr:MAG: metal-dependent hydrolase [Chloroflexota bacterium]RLC97173.1 MAG: metal-dependent hydrolase [Chloroflexota bacterium]